MRDTQRGREPDVGLDPRTPGVMTRARGRQMLNCRGTQGPHSLFAFLTMKSFTVCFQTIRFKLKKTGRHLEPAETPFPLLPMSAECYVTTREDPDNLKHRQVWPYSWISCKRCKHPPHPLSLPQCSTQQGLQEVVSGDVLSLQTTGMYSS